jgi:peptidoglycan/xylan/chitin deacetylase (PgdA/CDA1 family)
MTRFQIALLLALLGSLASLLLKSVLVSVFVAAVFVVVFALGITFPQMRFFGPYVCNGKPDHRAVALTFDDGPDPRSTLPLLDLLSERKIPAAFFCIGERVDAHPDMAARIVKEGHLLENHSYSHSYVTNLFTARRLRDELERTHGAIQKAGGAKPSCFRPPLGLPLLELPLAVVAIVCFSLGVGLAISALAHNFADVVDLYQVILTAWMYFTPVIYPRSIVPEPYQWLLALNPMTYFVESFRAPIYDNAWPSANVLVTSLTLAAAALTAGWWLFTRAIDGSASRG